MTGCCLSNSVIIVVNVFLFCSFVVDCKVVKRMNESEENMSENNILASRFLRTESRKKQNQDSIMTRILPMLVMPFIIQTTFLPMMLVSMKFMLIKSIFLGKLAIIFWIINLLKNRLQDNEGQFYSHNIHIGQHQGHHV